MSREKKTTEPQEAHHIVPGVRWVTIRIPIAEEVPAGYISETINCRRGMLSREHLETLARIAAAFAATNRTLRDGSFVNRENNLRVVKAVLEDLVEQMATA